uniref:Ankyrin repeat domain 53 n=1 Tax=Pelodiscus sinensis TaxID=13735 RepID=K7FVD8_PELSI
LRTLPQTSLGFSAIHLAALHGRLECLKLIIENFEVDVNLPSLTGWSPIHLVMNKESGPNALECLQYLIEKGADINVQNQGGMSPLHKAASEGRLDCIIELVEAGADVHAKDLEGQEPFDLCKIRAHRSCASLRNAMWKIEKRNFACEMHKLNQLKSHCQRTEQHFLKVEKDASIPVKEQPRAGPSGSVLPGPQGMSNNPQQERASVASKSAPRQRLAQRLFLLISSWDADFSFLPQGGETPQPSRGKSQRAWNTSVNPSSPVVTDIFRPTTVRLGTDPEVCGDHDFSSFLFLSKDARGKPVSKWLTPAPYDVIERSLYPGARPLRIKLPQDFKPTHIFDVKRKRLPRLEHRWTDEIALSLRETLDPAFRALLQTH